MLQLLKGWWVFVFLLLLWEGCGGIFVFFFSPFPKLPQSQIAIGYFLLLHTQRKRIFALGCSWLGLDLI